MNGSSCTNGCCGDFHFTRIHPWAPLFLSVALHITICQYKTNPQYKLPKKPLLITIDDGYANNYSLAYPILKEKGLRATIYIITSYRGKQPGVTRHFTWAEAKEMYDSGVINIESHTHDLHYYVQQVSPPDYN